MISIVLGTFFGDEGKGQTVHNLCNKYIGKRESVLVVRTSSRTYCKAWRHDAYL